MNLNYHIMLGDRRTTVSLDETLSGMLSIKLGKMPETAEAHAAVRQWLQQRLDEFPDPGRIRVSQWLQRKAIEFLVPSDLAAAYNEFCIADETILTGYLDKFLSKD